MASDAEDNIRTFYDRRKIINFRNKNYIILGGFYTLTNIFPEGKYAG